MSSPDLNDAGMGQLAPSSGQDLDASSNFTPLSARYPDQQLHEGIDFATTAREYLRILNKRKGLILAITFGVLALGLVRTLMMTPLYTSTIRLQIDRNVSKIVEGGNVTPVEGGDTEFLRTQYELLQSRSLSERVASSARLAEDPGFLRPRAFSILDAIRRFISPPSPTTSDNKRELTGVAAGVVQQNIAVRPIAGSRLVELAYTDPDPGRSQKIVSAYAGAFIAANLDKRFEANAYAKTFLEDQLKQLKLRLEQSEKTMLEFATKEQIVSIGESSSIVETSLANASAALGNITSERIKNEQLWRQIEHSDTVDFPQFLGNTAIDDLRSKRNQLVTDYQEKLQTFKPDYPVMIQINNRIAEVDKQLSTEIRTIRGSLKSAYESSVSQEAETKARVEQLRTDVLDFQKRSIEYNILKREVDTNRELYNGLLQRFKEVDIAGGSGSNNVFIVDRADLPDSPSSPQIMRAALLSLLLGLGAGLSLAYLLENFDDVIDSIEEAERVGGLPTLGVIPFVKSAERPEAMLTDARSALSEAYRSLCTSLQFTTARGMPKSLFVTSASAQEGKSLSALAITQHFARLGLKVLLVDADMRKPSLHKLLNADNSIGLSSYLTGACAPPDAIQKTDNPNLAFMPSGPIPPNAADLLSSPRLMSLLSVGLEVFDLVVIDGPPLLGIADAPLLSNAAEATVFVIGSGVARAGSVRSALRRLEISKCPLIGSVLTKFDAKKAGYGYGYGYAYGHSDSFSYGRSIGDKRSSRSPALREDAA